MARLRCRFNEGSGAEKQRAAGQPVELPSDFHEYVLVMKELDSRGIWSWAKERVVKRRSGSYEFCDGLAFLVCYFCSSRRGESLRDFATRTREYGPELAACVGRLDWISQPSLSRLFRSIDPGLAEEAADTLLARSTSNCAASDYVRATGYLDGKQERWEVFHWDATVDTMRKRSLPRGEDLPAPRRRVDELGAPGHRGRKRGEVQVSRSAISVATTAQWLDCILAAGNGDLHALLEHSAEAVAKYVGEDPARSQRCVVVADGVSGGVPQATALRKAGLMFLTRGNAYSWLEKSPVREALESGIWHPVQDSGSGPRREAMDLGVYEVSDGLSCRMVVSRYPATKKRGRVGKLIDAWRYELFFTDLPADRWAANDVVTLYYGRTAIENRFAGEDREIGLGRVYSFSPPGQTFACAVGLMLWNLRVERGLAAMVTPGEQPKRRPQRLREEVSADDQAQLAPPAAQDEATRSEDATARVNAKDVTPVGAGAALAESPSELPAAPEEPNSEGEPPGEEAPERPTASATAQDNAGPTRDEIMAAWCAKNPGWSASPSQLVLVCPAGQNLRGSGVRASGEGRPAIRFRAPAKTCTECDLLAKCSRGRARSPKYRREVVLPAPSGTLRSRLELTGPYPLPLYIPAAPVLLPAVLRQTALKLLKHANISVQVVPLDLQQTRDIQLALDEADRQRCRLTQEQRIALNEHPNADQTCIMVEGGRQLLRALGSGSQEGASRSG